VGIAWLPFFLALATWPKSRLEQCQVPGRLACFMFAKNWDLIDLLSPVQGELRWVACVIIFGLLMVVAAALLVAGLVTRHLTAFKFQLALLVVLLPAVSLRVVFWTLKVTGYQNIGHAPQYPKVSSEAVEIMERTGTVLFAVLFAVFTYVLVHAMIKSYALKSKRWGMLFGITCVAVTTVIAAYSITMGIWTSSARRVFLIDLSVILLSGMLLAFVGCLVVAFAVAVRLTKASKAAAEESRRNAVIFLWCSVGFAGLFLIRFIIAALFLFRDYGKYLGAFVILKIACDTLTGLAVLSYVGMSVYPSIRRARKTENRTGYIPMHEEEESGAIPKQYEA